MKLIALVFAGKFLLHIRCLHANVVTDLLQCCILVVQTFKFKDEIFQSGLDLFVEAVWNTGNKPGRVRYCAGGCSNGRRWLKRSRKKNVQSVWVFFYLSFKAKKYRR